MGAYFSINIIEKIINIARTVAQGNKDKESFVIKRMLIILEAPAGDEQFDEALKRIKQQYFDERKEPLINEEKSTLATHSSPATQIFPAAPEAPQTSWFYRLSRIFIKKDDPGAPPQTS